MSGLEPLINQWLTQPKNRKLAVVLALLGSMTPLAGLHKFYLGQPWWGVVYVVLGWSTPIARLACAIEAVWYLAQDEEQFQYRFSHQVNQNGTGAIAPSPFWSNSSNRMLSGNQSSLAPQVEDISGALRELDTLRADGLMSEYEFEQKRRQLLDRIA